MKLTVNGEERHFEDGATIAQILKTLGIQEQVMAVALNGSIVKREEWERVSPKDGDRLEFLTFVGGG
ncbi:MAG: thiamine biosynthesis protein ThiS [Nitratiruptor sp.]|nr:thiamine biosynthesis protein ThiS [Nitratiruptor sp.]NPA83250.1 sulfur carrier protein ThiS [Campylobacterota bacterium]